MAACPGHSQGQLRALSRRVDQVGHDTDWEGGPMQTLLNAANINMLDQGGSRTVIALCTEHVSKFEPTLSGQYGNRIELDIWKNAPPQLREHLVPIFDSGTDPVSGTNWIVMGRATPVNPDVDDDLESFASAIHGIGDLYEWSNLGVYQGHLVVIDYGERTSELLDFAFSDRALNSEDLNQPISL